MHYKNTMQYVYSKSTIKVQIEKKVNIDGLITKFFDFMESGSVYEINWNSKIVSFFTAAEI